MIKNYAAGYAIFMGISMMGMWVAFYLGGQIPELVTRPLEIMMHLAAEFLTALLLIIGGISFWNNARWGYSVYLLAMGMLIYTVIMSPGYFLQNGEYAFTIMFGAFFTLAVVLTIMTIRWEIIRQDKE